MSKKSSGLAMYVNIMMTEFQHLKVVTSLSILMSTLYQ